MPMSLSATSIFKEIYPKIKSKKNSNFWLEKMTNLWNFKINQCVEIFSGSKMTELKLSLDFFLDQLKK